MVVKEIDVKTPPMVNMKLIKAHPRKGVASWNRFEPPMYAPIDVNPNHTAMILASAVIWPLCSKKLLR